jgi:cytochrome c oxidase assembly protein subunit 15
LAKQRLISWLALIAVFFALGVIGLGAFTRLVDAGLGCPDWPRCYGHFMVPAAEKARQLAALQYPGSPFVTYKAWAEMVHRYFAGCLSILIIIILIMVFKNAMTKVSIAAKRIEQRFDIILAVFLGVLLVYQIILGQWTVTLKLLPVIVTQHLLGGFLILSVLWLMYLNHCVPINNERGKRGLLFLSSLGLVLLFLQIALGAWTSTNYASLSCPDFPFCQNNQSFFAFYFKQAFTLASPTGINYQGGVLPVALRQTIQMLHRIGALIFTSYMMLLTLYLSLKFNKSFDLMRCIYFIWALLSIQLCLGITNVILKLPLLTAISHTMVAALLLLAMITLLFKIVRVSGK